MKRGAARALELTTSGVWALLALATVLIAPPSVMAQRVSGTVVDRASKLPIAGAMVQLLAVDSSVTAAVLTDSAGTFRVDSPTERVASAAFVARLGYKDVRVSLPRGSQVTLEIELEPAPVPLDSVRARAAGRNRDLERVGFYDRQRFGTGRFITRVMLETSHLATQSTVADVLELVPGIAWTRETVSGAVVYMRGAGMTLHGPCAAAIFVDGLPQPDPVLPPLRTQDVEAIEVYVGPAQIPVQYASLGAMCGVVLVWTRTGATERRNDWTTPFTLSNAPGATVDRHCSYRR